MGMYTALSLGVELNIPRDGDVYRVLDWMLNGDPTDGGLTMPDLPAHPFFECSRAWILLRCDSYYFSYDTGWTLRWDAISESYYLSGVSNLKNYSAEITKFLDWLNPYIHRSQCGFIGWMMYEEQFAPDLIMRRCDGDEPQLHYVRTEHFVEQETQT